MKRIVLIGLTVLLMLAAAACGSQKQTAEGTDIAAEEAGQRADSKEMLVDGLEYLLSEEKQDLLTISEDASLEKDSGEQDGEELLPAAEDTAKERAVIYYSSGRMDELAAEEVEFEELTPEQLLQELARHNVVSIDTKLLSFEEKESVQAKYLYLDLSGAFGEYLKTMTQEAECILLAAITDTYLDNYEGTELFLMVEGETLRTAYAEYQGGMKKGVPEDLLAEYR